MSEVPLYGGNSLYPAFSAVRRNRDGFRVYGLSSHTQTQTRETLYLQKVVNISPKHPASCLSLSLSLALALSLSLSRVVPGAFVVFMFHGSGFSVQGSGCYNLAGVQGAITLGFRVQGYNLPRVARRRVGPASVLAVENLRFRV